MKNLKIKYKFIVCLGIIVAMLIFNSYAGTSTASELLKDVIQLNDEAHVIERQVNDAVLDIENTLSSMAAAIMTRDGNEVTNAKSDATELINSANSTLEAISSEDSDINKFKNTTISSLAKMADSRHEIFDAAEDGDYDEALELFFGEFFTNYTLLKTEIESLGTAAETYSGSLYSYIKNYTGNAVIFLTAVAVVGVLIALIVSFILTKSFTKPIKEIEHTVQNIASGNLKVELNYRSEDEFGVLSDSIRDMVNKNKVLISSISDNLGELSKGNFCAEIKEKDQYIGDYSQLLKSLEEFSVKINDTLLQVSHTAQLVSTGSSQVSVGAQALAEGASVQAQSVQDLAQSVNQISSQVNENASNSLKASAVASQVADAIVAGSDQMQNMMDSMAEIDSRSKEISKIIMAIEDISFQTNILALNAAVEAARAGSAGKGFAVVADEVRNLAGKSSEAAKNTTALIEASIHAIDKGVSVAKITSQNLNGIVENATVATDLMKKIADATTEQAEAIDNITGGLDQISAVIHTNSATSEESAAASADLTNQAGVLNGLISNFTLVEKNQNTRTPSPRKPQMEKSTNVNAPTKSYSFGVNDKY